MGKIVKAILIDPFKCSVSEVDLDASDYRNIYKHISHETMRVDIFTVAYPGDPFDSGDAIFVDDEGPLKACSRYFRVRGYSQPLCGKGLIIGSDDAGHERSARTPIQLIKRGLLFLERVEGLGLIQTYTPWQPRHEVPAH